MLDAAQIRTGLEAIRDHRWLGGEPGTQAVFEFRALNALKRPVAAKLGSLPVTVPELAGWLAGNLDKYEDEPDVMARIGAAVTRWNPQSAQPEPVAADMPPRPQGAPERRKPGRPRRIPA